MKSEEAIKKRIRELIDRHDEMHVQSADALAKYPPDVAEKKIQEDFDLWYQQYLIEENTLQWVLDDED